MTSVCFLITFLGLRRNLYHISKFISLTFDALSILLLPETRRSFAGDLKIGSQFNLKHDNGNDRYIDGLDCQISYEVMNKIEFFFLTSFHQWSSGRQRPAPGYDFEFKYKQTSCLAGIRYYHRNNKIGIRPYAQMMIGTEFNRNEDNWTYYILNNFGVENTSTGSHNENRRNIGIGLGMTFPVLGSLLYDMSVNLHSATTFNSHTVLALGFSYRF